MMHSHIATNILLNKELTILSGLSKSDKEYFISLTQQLILATDMSKHNEYIQSFSLNFVNGLNTPLCESDSLLLMSYIIKAADINNSVKPTDISSAWSNMLQNEMFDQVL